MANSPDDNLPTSLFGHDEPGPFSTLQGGGSLMAAAVSASADGPKQMQRFVGDRFVNTRRMGTGKLAQHVVAPSDILTAAALRAGFVAGLHNDDMRAASLAMYNWDINHPRLIKKDDGTFQAPASHPATAAAYYGARGVEWVLHIVRRVHPETAERRTEACCSDADAPFLALHTDDKGFEVEMVIAIRLSPIARKLAALYAATRQSANAAKN